MKNLITAVIFTLIVTVFLAFNGYNKKSTELFSNSSTYDVTIWKELKETAVKTDNITWFRDKTLATGTDAAPKLANS
ncbi:MAG: hypothetical protein H7844_09925 [Nitrospirae bacterium YQR-1]